MKKLRIQDLVVDTFQTLPSTPGAGSGTVRGHAETDEEFCTSQCTMNCTNDATNCNHTHCWGGACDNSQPGCYYITYNDQPTACGVCTYQIGNDACDSMANPCNYTMDQC